MKFKPGVNPFGLRPELLVALVAADNIWRMLGGELVVTSINDGKHSRTSLHYTGAAADLRTRDFSDDIKQTAAWNLRSALGDNPDFDVVVEEDHIHLEYQPKYRGLPED